MRKEPASPPRRLSRAVTAFLHTEAAGGAVLLVAAVVALFFANSPWRHGWEQLWHTEVVVHVGRWSLEEDLRDWVNDGLMAVFFFVVGLEIKRELVVGELRDPRQALVPAVAALGGMVVPALLFTAVAAGSAGSRGWGIPMATDIAFAVGVVAVLGRRVPQALKLFLLTLAIVDDVGAILVIALVYSSGIDGTALAVAAGLVVVIVAIRRAGVQSVAVYAVLGAAVWLATLESGVHATIAGVVLGLLTPARPTSPEALTREWSKELSEEPTADELREISEAATSGISVAERLEHQLHPVSSFLIIPIFALANAGVRIESDALDAPGASQVVVGVALGLVVGKVVGVFGATWLVVRSGLGRLPEGAGWTQVMGIAALAGIGFTVSLFVAALAYDGPELEAAAKLGVLGGSIVAALVGSILLATRRPAASDAVQEPLRVS